ncbi:uncharacterized protein LOC144248757 [Lonchura striata]
MSDNLNDKELEAVNNCGEHCCSHLRPLIKTEYNYLSDDDLDPHITTKHIPYTATELAKLKKEYGRLPYESETEYVFRVSLTGGDQIKLTEQEASGYWGHGVFLTTGDKRDSWSLTQRAAFWAGGTNPLERGDPIAIISTPDQLLESVHKAACLQMIHEKKLIPGFESPMQLPVKPELMTPLIRGLPETLKPTAIALQKTIMTLSPTEKLDRFLEHGQRTNSPSASPSSPEHGDAEKRYATWEKGLFVVSLALIEVERLALQLPIVLRSPFNDIKTVTTGTLPPDGVAQRASKNSEGHEDHLIHDKTGNTFLHPTTTPEPEIS